jgi:hypothetical protein
MTPELLITIAIALVTAIGIPFFNYLNTTKQTIIKNDILNTLSSDTNRIRDGINKNAADLKASRAEIKLMLISLTNRINGIERYLEKINGFLPSSGDTHNSRSED